MNESPPGHICVSETKHNPFIYVIIENTLNLILLLKCSWKSPYFWSPVFVLQQSHTSPLNYFLKDCYRFIFFLFRSYAILYSSRSIFRNFGIALLFADCQLAQSHSCGPPYQNNVALKILTHWHCGSLRPKLLAEWLMTLSGPKFTPRQMHLLCLGPEKGQLGEVKYRSI